MDTLHSTISSHTLGDLLRRTRARFPRQLAIACGPVQWTYEQFDTICDRLAAGLAGQGVEIGDRVAILSRNSHAFAAMRFAVARLGAVLVPINFMLTPQDANYILTHSGARMLVVDSGNASLGQAAIAGTQVTRMVWLPSEEPSLPVEGLLKFDDLLLDGPPPRRTLDDSMPAQIVYTSGTESRPKGAMLTHHAVISEYVSCLVDGEISSGDRLLHALPLYHCAQLDCFLGPAIYVGATNYITGKPTPDNLLSLLARHQITSFFAPPTVWIALLGASQFDGTDLTSLRKGYYGASIMPVAVLNEMQQRMPGLRLWNFYGQTEIAPVATILKPEDQLRKPGSAGRPVLNVETRVVDDEMNDLPPGAVGEIVHRSPQLLTGYYNDEARSREAFAGGWFHSGDLGILDEEGYLTVVDRKKDMIKSGGENVASREVEEFLYKVPGVSEVAVIGVADPKWIEAVTAVIVSKAGHQLTEQEVINACEGQLASFKTPKRVIFVDALPKNPSGKLLKRELRKAFAGV